MTQKKCVRILFGDFEKYADKYRTCARTRPVNSQKLGSKFYEKESTKPLFAKHELLAVENLYRHRSVNVNVNVNVISRTALIRNRVSRRVLHVSKITWGILYLFQEAQTH